MPNAGIARQAGNAKILRSRCEIKGLVDKFPVVRVSALSFSVGAVQANNGTDVHQNNFTPGQPATSDQATLEFIVYKEKFKAVQDWVKACMDGVNDVERKTLTYHILHPQQDKDAMVITWHDCYPIAMELLGSDVDAGQDVLRGSITLKVLRMTLG
jgi:hypothetical protein